MVVHMALRQKHSEVLGGEASEGSETQEFVSQKGSVGSHPQ